MLKSYSIKKAGALIILFITGIISVYRYFIKNEIKIVILKKIKYRNGLTN